MKHICILDGLALIEVYGNDRVSFLQAQLSQDLELLNNQHSPRAALLTPQGRVAGLFRVCYWNDRLFLSTTRSLAETLIAYLRRYVLRAKVSFAESDAVAVAVPGALRSELSSFGLEPPGNGRDGETRSQPEACVVYVATEPPGYEVYCSQKIAQELLNTLAPGKAAPNWDPWRAAAIATGIPVLSPATHKTFVAHRLNLDLIGAVSFDKGCYPGQEIVARTHNLGVTKRRMLRFEFDGGHCEPGDPVYAGGEHRGTVINACGKELLAVLRLDAVNDPLFLDAEEQRNMTLLPVPYRIPELG